MLEPDANIDFMILSKQMELLSDLEKKLSGFECSFIASSGIIRIIASLREKHAVLYLDTSIPNWSDEVSVLLRENQSAIHDLIQKNSRLIVETDIHGTELKESILDFLKRQCIENDALALVKIIGIGLLVSHVGTEYFDAQFNVFSPIIKQISTSIRPQLLVQANTIFNHERTARFSSDICWTIARFSAYFAIMSALFALVFSMFYQNIGTSLGVIAGGLLCSAMISHLAYIAIEKYSPYLPAMYYGQCELSMYNYPDQDGNLRQRASFTTNINGNPHHLFAQNSLVQDESVMCSRLLQLLRDEHSRVKKINETVASSSYSINI